MYILQTHVQKLEVENDVSHFAFFANISTKYL